MFYTQGSRPLELHSCYIRPTGIFDTNNHNEQAELLMRHRAVVLATARDTGWRRTVCGLHAHSVHIVIIIESQSPRRFSRRRRPQQHRGRRRQQQ